MDWRRELRELAAAIGSQVRQGANALERLVDQDPYHIVGYRGYGTGSRALLLGRVLQNEGLAVPDPAHSKLRNLLAMLKRIESDPLPHARVRARLPDREPEVAADDEGFLRARLQTGELPEGWMPIHLELIQSQHEAPITGVAPVLVPPASAECGVISDMDDTVLQSNVTNLLRAARVTLLENARTRLPFPGVAGFYRALAAGSTGRAGNPIFYVSSSPWNFYDVIADFLEAQQIPTGPLLLRNWDLGLSLLRNAPHKSDYIADILDTYPSLPFILVGDSAQEDPEIYTEIVIRYPRRIRAVYIRNVRPHPERSAAVQQLARRVAQAGSTLVLADDTLTVASHAAAHGWISPALLPEVREEKRADEGQGGKTPSPGVEKSEPAPTVVVDPTVRAADLE
ncbi:MAG TPA: phosphatase domain-containing protein [Gemmatimonadales bacterium]|nr:phosphatase domain-containing protein [Gemmatimonadales bacterium]